MNLASRNDYQHIDEAIVGVESSEIVAQGYIEAASRGNDDVMFVLDNLDIPLTQEQIDNAFRAAAEKHESQAMIQIARNHKISDELAQSVIQKYIDSDTYINIEFARELEREITEFNRYYVIMQNQQQIEQPQIAPTTPRP
jgi:hypothetical protein